MEIVARLVQHQVVQGRAMVVHHEDPAKALLAQLAGQVHEGGTQGLGPPGISSGEGKLAAEDIRARGAERDGGKEDDLPAGPPGDRFGQRLRPPLVHIGICSGRQVRAVLLEQHEDQTVIGNH